MIRILAASLSAAALIAASVPAEAQQRLQGTSARAPGQPGIAAKRVSSAKRRVGQRQFRSFNPPAPFGQPAGAPRAFSRGLAPPTPGGPTSQQSIYPGAPSGGQTYVGLPSGVPASLPPPQPGAASPSAAPVAPTEAAPLDDLQPPIPETVAAQPEPAVQQIVPVPQPIVRQVYEVRVVYVPVYPERRVHRRRHVHVPHYAFHSPRYYGPRIHFGPRFRGGFRW